MQTPYDEFLNKHGGAHSSPSMSRREMESLVDGLQFIVACAVASALDAGSERDAVCEDEDLRQALFALVEGWWEEA